MSAVYVTLNQISVNIGDATHIYYRVVNQRHQLQIFYGKLMRVYKFDTEQEVLDKLAEIDAIIENAGVLWHSIGNNRAHLDNLCSLTKTIVNGADEYLTFIWDETSVRLHCGSKTSRDSIYTAIKTVVEAIPSTLWTENTAGDKLFNTARISEIREQSTTRLLLVYSGTASESLIFDSPTDLTNDLTLIETKTATVSSKVALLTPTEDMSELNLDGMVIGLELVGCEFDDGALDKNNFTLNNAPAGTTIDSVAYVDANNANITLAFDGTDFDSSVDDFSITVDATELDISDDVISAVKPILASNEVITATPAETMTELNLDGMVITLALTGCKFADDTLVGGNFTLNNAPAGTTVDSVEWINNKTAEVTLAFDGTDFDADVDDFSITVAAAELDSVNDVISEVMSITTKEETITLTPTEAITEVNLDGMVITLALVDCLFADETLDSGNFTLNNAPAGTTVDSVAFVDETTAEVTLAFDGTDFDVDVTDFSITVDADELNSSNDVTSGDITITAMVEEITATPDEAMTETNLDGMVIELALSDCQFADETLDSGNFTLNNAPAGTTVDSVDYTDATHADVTLAFDGTDFDVDVIDFSITVDADELDSANDVTSQDMTITAVVE